MHFVAFLPRVFDGTKFDVVINLAGETRFSLTEEVVSISQAG